MLPLLTSATSRCAVSSFNTRDHRPTSSRVNPKSTGAPPQCLTTQMPPLSKTSYCTGEAERSTKEVETSDVFTVRPFRGSSRVVATPKAVTRGAQRRFCASSTYLQASSRYDSHKMHSEQGDFLLDFLKRHPNLEEEIVQTLSARETLISRRLGLTRNGLVCPPPAESRRETRAFKAPPGENVNRTRIGSISEKPRIQIKAKQGQSGTPTNRKWILGACRTRHRYTNPTPPPVSKVFVTIPMGGKTTLSTIAEEPERKTTPPAGNSVASDCGAVTFLSKPNSSHLVQTGFGFCRHRVKESAGMSQQKYSRSENVENDVAESAKKHIYTAQIPSLTGRGSRAVDSLEGLRETLYFKPQPHPDRCDWKEASLGVRSNGVDWKKPRRAPLWPLGKHVRARKENSGWNPNGRLPLILLSHKALVKQ